MNSAVQELADRVYPFKAEQLEDGTWYVTVPDLPGCVSYDKNLHAAVDNLREAKIDWMETALTAGVKIPEPSAPSQQKSCSGKILLRIPRSLHARLSAEASEENVSLNQYLVHLLSDRSGRRQMVEELVQERLKETLDMQQDQ
ncbi:toxin-antitoxin system HicB family antitoxin [bacterium]|nr:toxin-antitoxin system HicB family antitoxin [candidate division CSSED10-310 bacterium]